MRSISVSANSLSDGDIAATNVLPAFETSLRFGATESELESELGWRRDELQKPEAHVTGESTYRHLEIMHDKPDYGEFVLATAKAHDAATLGVLGLACKTASNVGAAMACHARFQHLTNRTARYDSRVEEHRLHLREERYGSPRLGSLLMSDLTMFIALHLLSLVAQEPPTVIRMHSRRAEIPGPERSIYEAFVGAKIHVGAPRTELVFEAALLHAPLSKADIELETYFRSILEGAARRPDREPELKQRVRRVLGEHLVHGTPTVGTVARSVGLGSRTLQRRLKQLGINFADLLDEVRRDLAESYMRRPELGLAEIAYLLGFAEQASFFRAFRRWHSSSPSAYRRSLRGDDTKK